MLPAAGMSNDVIREGILFFTALFIVAVWISPEKRSDWQCAELLASSC
jgi:hypothetical protein